MSDTTTRGIRIEAESTYEEERSSPAERYYFFSYRVRISNVGDTTAQLLSRLWIVTDADGNQVEGFQAHLGGQLGEDAGYGLKLRGHKVTSAELGDYIERLVRAFAAGREPEETFRSWVARSEEDALR